MQVAIVQNKPRKGPPEQNVAALREAFSQLANAAPPPGLVVLPEAALTGYFLEGAVYECARSAEAFAELLSSAWRAAPGAADVDIACGFYENCDGTFYNSALYLELRGKSNRILHVHRKMFLPTYGVFDEERFLSRGRSLGTFETKFGEAALLICEDAWHAIMPTIAAVKGARFLIVPSASPGRGVGAQGELESVTRWRALLSSYAAEHGVFILYAGLTGFEGGKGMTGSSCIVGPRGEMIVQAPVLGACIVNAEIDTAEIDVARAGLPLLGDLRAVLPDLLLDDELPLARPAESTP